MKKLLLILTMNAYLIFALSGCSQQSAQNGNQIKTNLSTIIQAVSKKFGEANPKNILVKQDVEESSKKPMFFVSFEGNFVHPWETSLEKANKLTFSYSVENKLWAITGLKDNHMLWFIKLPSLKWREVINLSKEDYWKKVIVENKYINLKEIAWIRIEGGVPNPLRR